jgi:protein Tex
VLDVDAKRKRIALSMRKNDDEAAPRAAGAERQADKGRPARPSKPAKNAAAPMGSLGAALAEVLQRK